MTEHVDVLIVGAGLSGVGAACHLEERLRERGDDELAVLARSFNRMADSLQRQIRQFADLRVKQPGIEAQAERRE